MSAYVLFFGGYLGRKLNGASSYATGYTLQAWRRVEAWRRAIAEAIQQEKGPVFLATLHGTRLDDVAVSTYRAAPDDLARLGFAVAHALCPEAPPPTDLSAEVEALAAEIARALQEAERPLIVSGTGCRNHESGIVCHVAGVGFKLKRFSVD